jgi:uncharacterized coiled-coil protein SlyX
MARMKLDNTDLEKRIILTEERLSNIEKLIEGLKKQLPET